MEDKLRCKRKRSKPYRYTITMYYTRPQRAVRMLEGERCAVSKKLQSNTIRTRNNLFLTDCVLLDGIHLLTENDTIMFQIHTQMTSLMRNLY